MDELMLRGWMAITELADRAAKRMAREEGQTAAEYLGIIVLVGLIFAAIFKLQLHTTISTKIKEVVDMLVGGTG